MNNIKYLSAAAVLATSSMMMASPIATAAIVCNTVPMPITAPADNTGIYLNFVTGQSGTTAPAGWDFNPYLSTTGGALRFWWDNAPTLRAGLLDGAGTSFAVLAAGAPINAAGTYSGSNADAQMAPWRAGATGYLGLRFTNEATAATNFGWIQMTSTAGTGYPLTLTSYCYQNDGTGITAGTTPVSLQSFSVD